MVRNQPGCCRNGTARAPTARSAWLTAPSTDEQLHDHAGHDHDGQEVRQVGDRSGRTA